MPLKLDVERILLGKSERVKSVDLHPKEPWVLAALYSGDVFIWNFETETVVRTFEVCEVPVRCAKFVPRKNWIVCCADDMTIRVYNYNTCEKVKEIEAHTDYIRSLAIHPSLPFVLSASDDMSVKLFDWDNGWENSQVFEGHTHYVMQVEFNPKDSNSFATASLDRTVKVWGLSSPVPHFQLEGHEKGVNCVSFYQGGERPFLISGADDNLVKVWDYTTKNCVATLEGHSNNISAVLFHPQLPIIITGSEDGAIKIWHSATYRLETTLHYGMQRVWSLNAQMGSNKVAIGFDDGTVVIKLGQEEPVVSMDLNGKVVWARSHEISLVLLQKVLKQELVDGEPISVAPDDLRSCEFYPSTIVHNKNGQYVAVVGDGEYTVDTALKMKNKTFGSALDFVWSDRPTVYATRESSTKIKIFKNWKEHKTLRTAFSSEQLFGGHLLGVRSADFVDFYSWSDGRIVRRIEVVPTAVHWSDSGSLACVCCEDNFYVLAFNEDVVRKYVEQDVETDSQGIEPAFDLQQEHGEAVVSGHFTGEIFLYTTRNCRLNYFIGGQIITLAHFSQPSYILGYLFRRNRIFLIDRRYNISSYELLKHVLGYQAAIVRKDVATADKILAQGRIPFEHFNKLAHFLEEQGFLQKALEVSKDLEHQFELALQLKRLQLAKEILLKNPTPSKWSQLGDLALAECDFATVEECALKADDLSLLFLLYSATCYALGLEQLLQKALAKRRFDIAFNVMLILGKPRSCVDMLMQNDRIPEAAFVARSFCPDKIEEIQSVWKEELQKISPAAAASLGDKESHADYFAIAETEEEEEEEEKGSGLDVLKSPERAEVEMDEVSSMAVSSEASRRESPAKGTSASPPPAESHSPPSELVTDSTQQPELHAAAAEESTEFMDDAELVEAPDSGHSPTPPTAEEKLEDDDDGSDLDVGIDDIVL